MPWTRREHPCYVTVRDETLTADGPGRYRLARVEREVDPGSGEVTVTEAVRELAVDEDGWVLPGRDERLVLGDGTFTFVPRPLTEAERAADWDELGREFGREIAEYK